MSARDYIDDYDGEATEPEDSYEAIERDLLHASGQPLPFTVDGPANGDDSDDEDEASAEASPPTAPEAVQAINLLVRYLERAPFFLAVSQSTAATTLHSLYSLQNAMAAEEAEARVQTRLTQYFHRI